MSFDTNRSFFNDLRERPVLDGQTVAEEGVVLVYVDSGSGTLAVRPSDGTAGTDAAVGAAGFAITDALKLVTRAVVEELVVPAGGGVVSLRNQALVAGSPRAEDITAAATLTLVGGVPAAGQARVIVAAGTIEFNAAEAGNTVSVRYRYTPTLEELLATDHERSINNRAQDFFSLVSVGGLEGEIFTSHYDSSLAYAIGDAIWTGAGGLATSAVTSTVQIGVCSQVPSVADGLLGIKYSGLA
jgi:hypothetical protein